MPISDDKIAYLVLDQWRDPRPTMNGAIVTIRPKRDYVNLKKAIIEHNEHSIATIEELISKYTDHNFALVKIEGDIWPAIEVPWDTVERVMSTTRVFQLFEKGGPK